MKQLSFLLSFFIVTSLFAQEKYQGLLWEISGNGLEKNSYIYGNMHVSGRIAFHLGEEFFDAIKSVDAIALESNPIMWLDEILGSEYANNYLGNYAIDNQPYKGFYQDAFKLKKIDNQALAYEISSDHYLANWLLYRENKANSDFEEETFLDMFIYQAASKNNKPIYSLEYFEKTDKLTRLAYLPDMEDKEMPDWLKKMTKEKSEYDLISDAYRAQDLDMIDSLQSALSTYNNIKYMLYERNIIMALNIDSIIKTNTSLFIGIGAAHLPKDKGVINLLRQKGYTVKALPVTISKKSKDEIENFHKKKKQLPYLNEFETEFFSLKVPGKMYETPSLNHQRLFFSPELTNGSFFMVNQISTYTYFNQTNSANYEVKIDSLLFENIPGKIISKTPITKDGFKGIDVLNKTKSGNYQRYQFVFTPLNIFIFKMGGKDNFVEIEGNQFFNTIKMKPITKDWKKIQPLKTDFEVEVPNYYNIKNNTKIASLYGHTEIEAYDDDDKNYYFLKKASLFDTKFIEQDSFELHRIADMFLKELKIDSSIKEMDLINGYPSLLAYCPSKDSTSFISLKIIIKGAYYYLLANVSPTYKKSNPFFESFTFTDFSYTFDFKEKIDSNMQFKVNSNYISPGDFEQLFEIENAKKKAKKETKDTDFEYKYKTENYYSENFERIAVEFIKEHHYKQYLSLDSLWNKEINYIKKENKLIVLDKKYTQKDNIHYLDVIFGDTNSIRTIKTRIILKHGAVYVLKTTSDSLSKPSKFIETFFKTFTPSDSLIGNAVLASKSNLFFEALNGTDSLEKERALKSVKKKIIFSEKDVDRIIAIIKDYPFPENHIESKKQLIIDLGELNSPKIIPFLEQLYPVVEDTAMYQLAILEALIKQKNKSALVKFTKLLDYDIPLGSKGDDINSLFYSFRDSLVLAEVVYPQLLNFTFVSDYKKPIYNLLAQLVDSNYIKPKKYTKYYKQILREAKIELKSQISYEQAQRAKQKDKTSYYYSSYRNEGNQTLVTYSKLLIPFYTKKEVKAYFDKLRTVQDYQLLTDINCKLVSNDIRVTKEVWNYLADDVINYAYLYQELERIKRLDLFPKKENMQLEIAKSILYQKSFNFNEDSLEFISTKVVTVQNETGNVYFFKSKKPKDDNWKLDYTGLQPLSEIEVKIEDVVTKKGEKILKDKNMEELINEKIKSIEIIGHKRAREEDDGSSYFDFF